MQILLGKLKFSTKQPSRFYFYSPELHFRFSSRWWCDNAVTQSCDVFLVSKTHHWHWKLIYLLFRCNVSQLQYIVALSLKLSSYCKCLIKICLLNKNFNAVTLKTNKIRSKCPEASLREKDSAEKHYSHDFIQAMEFYSFVYIYIEEVKFCWDG